MSDQTPVPPIVVSRPAVWLAWITESPAMAAGSAILMLVIGMAILAPLISPQDPYDLLSLSLFDTKLPPGSQSYDGSTSYLLGTDGQGRDILSGILYGLRISLIVGFGSALIAGAIGTIVGIVAAYFGGWVEALIMRLVDLQLSFPAILVALMLLAFLGKGVGNVVLALVIVEWAGYARTARSAALVELGKDYLTAAKVSLLPVRRIIFVHLLPNCLPPLIVLLTIQVARAISLEATLSFLGVGVKATEPSLGMLIASGFSYILSGTYWITLFPGIALVVTVVAVNLIGDHLRVALNPKLRA
ncbi:ABC transporter permease [Xinfangfangia pollutisoli]|uniref:ABC transporter permease n=1 Tax=Xinfangfangia pollutisoli TaxID=2865960 RepID=UPI001CD438E1|nr:ABC transporter permease [Xinfangfangia pollutisoli]